RRDLIIDWRAREKSPWLQRLNTAIDGATKPLSNGFALVARLHAPSHHGSHSRPIYPSATALPLTLSPTYVSLPASPYFTPSKPSLSNGRTSCGIHVCAINQPSPRRKDAADKRLIDWPAFTCAAVMLR